MVLGGDCGFSSQALYKTEVHPTVVWEILGDAPRRRYRDKNSCGGEPAWSAHPDNFSNRGNVAFIVKRTQATSLAVIFTNLGTAD